MQVSPADASPGPDDGFATQEGVIDTSSTSAPTSAPPSRLCLSRRPTPMANPQPCRCRGGRENTTPRAALTSFVAADG